jgi:hypothetical protein
MRFSTHVIASTGAPKVSAVASLNPVGTCKAMLFSVGLLSSGRGASPRRLSNRANGFAVGFGLLLSVM